MRKKHSLLLVILVTLIAAVGFAATADTIVYVAASGEGKKYHIETCHYIKKGKQGVNLGQAIKAGYTPCSRCKPPKLDQ